MKWLHYKSLTPAAKRAFNRGNGKHGRYAVDGKYIAYLDDSGRALDWVLIIKSNSPIIVEQK